MATWDELLNAVMGRYAEARRVEKGVELSLTEMTSLEQIVALKEGRIDVGFGRVRHDDPAVDRVVRASSRIRTPSSM